MTYTLTRVKYTYTAQETHSASEGFDPSAWFAGRRPVYEFKKGEKGQGYYRSAGAYSACSEGVVCSKVLNLLPGLELGGVDKQAR